jgi:hypothetical protein
MMFAPLKIPYFVYHQLRPPSSIQQTHHGIDVPTKKGVSLLEPFWNCTLAMQACNGLHGVWL